LLDPDRHQNLFNFSLSHVPLLQKIHRFFEITGSRFLSESRKPHPYRDPDLRQNLMDWSLGHAQPLQKFYQNLLITFCDVFAHIHTDTHGHTDRYENITSSAKEVMVRSSLTGQATVDYFYKAYTETQRVTGCLMLWPLPLLLMLLFVL